MLALCIQWTTPVFMISLYQNRLKVKTQCCADFHPLCSFACFQKFKTFSWLTFHCSGFDWLTFCRNARNVLTKGQQENTVL